MKKILVSCLFFLMPFNTAYAKQVEQEEQVKQESKINTKAIYVAPKIIAGYQSTTLAGINASANAYYPGTNVRTGGGVFAGGIAVGYDFGMDYKMPIRLEAEVILGSSVKKKLFESSDAGIDMTVNSKYSVSTFFINYYHDFRKKEEFNPYLSGGIGMAFNTLSVPGNLSQGGISQDLDSVYPKKTSPFLAANIGIGCGYKIKENITIDAGYRLTVTNKAKTKTLLGDYIGSIQATFINQLIVGVRYNFK